MMVDPREQIRRLRATATYQEGEPVDTWNNQPYDDDPESWAPADRVLDPSVARWANVAAHHKQSAVETAETRNPGFRMATINQLSHQQILDASGISADDRYLYERLGMRMWRVELWKEEAPC